MKTKFLANSLRLTTIFILLVSALANPVPASGLQQEAGAPDSSPVPPGAVAPVANADGDSAPDTCDGCPADPDKLMPGQCGCGVADTDSDGDGIPNCIDTCPNDPLKASEGVCGCGVADTDADSDTVVDCHDNCPTVYNPTQIDTNHDGVGDVCTDACPDDPNKTEPGICGCNVPDTDTDSDSTPDCLDQCPNDPLKVEPGGCGCNVADTDTDGDGYLDCNDMCPDNREKHEPGVCGCGVSDVDLDLDGTPDCHDLCQNDPGKTAPGTCGCGVSDVDSDSDSVADCLDGCPRDHNKISSGVCGCGNPDTDTDNDDVFDCNDGCPDDPHKLDPGICGCGVADVDSDQDGAKDCNDSCPNDQNKILPGVCGCGVSDADTDGDYVPDCFDQCPGRSDTDTDHDGTPDCNDRCPTDPDKTVPGTCGCGIPETDSDSDGSPDCTDQCPNDPHKTVPAVCGCGYPETDSDSDGSPDCVDLCPFDPNKVERGSCGCGVPDTDTDSDGDAIPDCVDGCPNDPAKTNPGVCGCGEPDIDADGDGVYSCFDWCDEDPNKVLPGICGCGVPDVDSDADGTYDCYDLCPNDPEKLAPGSCGCGISDIDTDGDGWPDCNDLCISDPFKVEPGICGCDVVDTDTDGDGIPDCVDFCPLDPSNTDSDNDGVPDCADQCPGPDIDSDGDLTLDCKDACPLNPERWTTTGTCTTGPAACLYSEITCHFPDGDKTCLPYCFNDPIHYPNPCITCPTSNIYDSTPNLASFFPASNFTTASCSYKLAAPTGLTVSANSATLAANMERNISSRSKAEWTLHVPENLTIQAETTSDITPPVASLDSTPCLPTSSASASFGFSASDPYSGSGVNHFECSLDGAGYTACASGINYSGLSLGDHTFDVRAVDNANNTGAAVHFAWTVNPLPGISSLNPTSAVAGGADFTLTLNGSNFVDSATVQWNGSNLATTYGSPTQLHAAIPAGKISSPGVAYLTVTNPDSGVSNPLAFYITQTDTAVTVSEAASGENPTVSIGGATGVTATAVGSGTLSVAQYDSNPGGPATFHTSGGYIDVHLAPDNTFNSLTITDCDLHGGMRIFWWNGTGWALASDQVYDSATGCITITVTATTSPSLSDLTGTVFASAFPEVAPSITEHPQSRTVFAGETAAFTAAASGDPAPTVRWQVSADGGSTWSDIGGANATTLTLNNVGLSQNGNQYRAVFNNAAGTARTNAATLTVGKRNTTTTLSASLTDAIYHQPVTFTALVAPVSPATGAPAGTVTFMEGTTTLATNVPTVNGQAQFTTSDLAAGPHSVIAIFSGGPNWNSSASAPASVGVAYRFVGFTSPVDHPPVNIAKAGQTIPLKWRVLDYNNQPVTNLTTVKVTAVSLSCSVGTTTDLIEEYTAGASGLQNLGDGYYQWNWKSPTSYANSCKTLKLDLGEGVVHTAQFLFRK